MKDAFLFLFQLRNKGEWQNENVILFQSLSEIWNPGSDHWWPLTSEKKTTKHHNLSAWKTHRHRDGSILTSSHPVGLKYKPASTFLSPVYTKYSREGSMSNDLRGAQNSE